MEKHSKLTTTIVTIFLLLTVNRNFAQIKPDPVAQERTLQRVAKNMALKGPTICTFNDWDPTGKNQACVQVVEDFTGKKNDTIHRAGDIEAFGVDNKGNVYETNSESVKPYVRELKKIGEYSGILRFPTGVACDRQGRIYIADALLHQIIRIDDTNGGNLTTFGSKGSGIGQFKNPWGIVVDAAGHIFVADAGNSRIVRIDDMTGKGWITYQDLATQYVRDIALDSKGRIYWLLLASAYVLRIDDIQGSNKQQYRASSKVGGIGIDKENKIYLTLTDMNSMIRIDDIEGTNRVELNYGPTGNQLFHRPTHLAVFYPVKEKLDVR